MREWLQQEISPIKYNVGFWEGPYRRWHGTLESGSSGVIWTSIDTNRRDKHNSQISKSPNQTQKSSSLYSPVTKNNNTLPGKQVLTLPDPPLISSILFTKCRVSHSCSQTRKPNHHLALVYKSANSGFSFLYCSLLHFTCAFGFFKLFQIRGFGTLRAAIQSEKMKIFVKTLKGTHFEIEVEPQDTVSLNHAELLLFFVI